MLEIEMKFPVADFAALRSKLAEWKAAGGQTQEEADQYFNAPDRDFARTDEALRLRRVGEESFICYKGPKIDALTKTRTEINMPLANGDEAAEDCVRVLTYLGYRPVAVVRKKRRLFTVQRGGFELEVCLDEVRELGCFVEVEIRAPKDQLDAARSVLLETAAELGLTESVRRSYLEMLLEKAEKGPTP
jgi:adenylate cyclase class 2